MTYPSPLHQSVGAYLHDPATPTGPGPDRRPGPASHRHTCPACRAEGRAPDAQQDAEALMDYMLGAAGIEPKAPQPAPKRRHSTTWLWEVLGLLAVLFLVHVAWALLWAAQDPAGLGVVP